MKTFESFQSNRWIWRVNLALQVLLVFALTAIVNFIAMTFFVRADLTRNRAFSLAPETLANIHELRVPVTIVVTIAGDDDNVELAQAARDVRGLLRQFIYAARESPRGSLRVENVNVFEQRRRAETLGVSDQPNVVLFLAGARRHLVTLRDLYEVTAGRRGRFLGERVFAAALLDVAQNQRPVVYFLKGHGEMRLEDVDPQRGASQLETQLSTRNYDVRSLDLADTRRVPDDASLVVILSPRTPVLLPEQEILRNYLSTRQGRLIVALDPGVDHGLDDLLFDWGILADNVLVIENDPRFRLPGGRDILIQRFAPHPVTQALADFQLRLSMGLVRSVRADPGRPIDDSLEVTELLFTSNESWGEVDFRNPRPVFDRLRDLPGPVRVATVAERKVDSRLNISLRGGRLIAIGNSDFIANDRIGKAANLTLFLNAVSWALERDTELNIPARPVEQLQLTLSQEQLTLARVSIVAGPGLLVALLGLAISFARRR